MGRKERRFQQQQEVRQSILDAAREIARAEGWRNVTMRKIAEKTEYSHPALYEYFENKDVLMLALLREGFHLLVQDMQAAQASTDEPHTAMRRMAAAYWRFAWRYPELYRVMNGLDGVSFSADSVQREGQKVADLYGAAIKAIYLGRGQVVSDEVLEMRIHLLWSVSHGIISLTMEGRMARGKEWAHTLYEQAIEDDLQKWEREAQAE
jgi:AcrR family transcriptional regulator